MSDRQSFTNPQFIPPYTTNPQFIPPNTNYEVDNRGRANSSQPESYLLSGKIMLSAIIILFVVVILIVGLHIYARWFMTRSRERQHLRRRRRRTHLVFTMSLSPSANTSRGLDASLLKSLPTFTYSTTAHPPLECAVCLSEFEETEKGRLLPKCNHSFHTECIDMWFHSHTTCPLCRTVVNVMETDAAAAAPVQIVIENDSVQTEPQTIVRGDEVASTSTSTSTSSSSSGSTSKPETSLGERRKALELVGVSIEVPRRNESFKNLEEEGQMFKSPGGRIRSFKRMLSRDHRRPATSPISCRSRIEVDLERGEEEEQGVVTPPPAPNPSRREALP